jgi:VanZ family protein
VEESAKPGEGPGLLALAWPVRLCLVILVGALVYWLGTSLFSAARMEPLVYPLFRSVFHVSDAGQLFYYLSVVRWTAHFLEYFVLFMLLVWVMGLRPLTALILCVLLAVADEGHQYFLPDRTCSSWDVKLDAAGAFTAFVLTAIWRRARRATPRVPKSVSGETQQASA